MPISSRFVIRSTIALLLVGFLTLLGIVCSTIWLGERARVYTNDVIEARDTRGAAVELRDAIRTAESSQRGYVLTGNEIYLAPFDSAKKQAQQQLDKLRQALAPYRQSEALLVRLMAVMNEKTAEMNRTISLKADGKDGEALDLMRTNRGKALMDEANLFLSGIIQSTDQRLTMGVREQQANATMLRWVSIVGGLVIILVVGGFTVTVLLYARELVRARDEVRIANSELERRVTERTSALAMARDRAEMLLSEVNHRVANSLSLVASLVKLQSNSVKEKAAKDALAETQARILAVASVHKRLYTSGDVRSVALDEYLSVLLDQIGASMRNDGHGATLKYELEPVRLATDASVNLGVVVTEWVTNAFKYAYPDRTGEVRVRLKKAEDGRGELVVEDDGVGRAAVTQGTGLGTRIVNAMATTMGGEVRYISRSPGTAASFVFPVKEAA
jgi:two-component sensor histidine kinase/CHASE3 domain sensor protein